MGEYVDTVEEHVSFTFGWSFEDFEVFEDLWVYFDGIQVSNGILSKKVKGDFIGGFKCNVFVAERTTADCIGFIFALFISRSQGKYIDEVHCRSTLSRLCKLVSQIAGVVFANSINMVLHGINLLQRRIGVKRVP